jgi:hypothetical protein
MISWVLHVVCHHHGIPNKPSNKWKQISMRTDKIKKKNTKSRVFPSKLSI